MRTPWWLLPNVLSLDAPVIAVLWQGFFAAMFETPITLAARVSLGLAVWAIYIADRLLDVRRAGTPIATARHRFHQDHRVAMRRLLGVLVVCAVPVVLLQVRPAVFYAGLVISVAVGVYLYGVHRGYLQNGKEFTVAFLFCAGTILAPLARADRKGSLLVGAAAFFVACAANTTLIEATESSLPPRVNVGVLIAIVLFLLCADAASRPVTIAASLSILALASLHAQRERVSSGAFRVLADAALLSPVPIWLVWRA
jgi:hypothetical protein